MFLVKQSHNQLLHDILVVKYWSCTNNPEGIEWHEIAGVSGSTRSVMLVTYMDDEHLYICGWTDLTQLTDDSTGANNSLVML